MRSHAWSRVMPRVSIMRVMRVSSGASTVTIWSKRNGMVPMTLRMFVRFRLFETFRLTVDERVFDGIESFARTRFGRWTKHVFGEPRPVQGAVRVQGGFAERLDDQGQRRSPGCDHGAGQCIIVDHTRAQVTQTRGDRAFPRGDAAGQSDSHSVHTGIVPRLKPTEHNAPRAHIKPFPCYATHRSTRRK